MSLNTKLGAKKYSSKKTKAVSECGSSAKANLWNIPTYLSENPKHTECKENTEKQRKTNPEIAWQSKTDGVIKKENGMYQRTESLDQNSYLMRISLKRSNEEKKGNTRICRITRQIKSNLMKERLIKDVRYQEWTEMTLDCVKNVSSLRERNSSQGSFLFVWETPEADRFEGLFVFTLQCSKPTRRFQHSSSELPWNTSSLWDKLLSFIWQSKPTASGKLGIPQLLDDAVVQVAGLGEILHHFSKILLHIGIAPFMHLTARARCRGKLDLAHQISSPMW